MTPAFLLCLALASDPTIPGGEVLRGCAVATPTDIAADAYGFPAPLLMAIARRETNIRPKVNASGHCGPWQVNPKWAEGNTCKMLKGSAGVWAAARILDDKRRAAHGDMKEALRLYSGSAKGSTWYAREVLALMKQTFGNVKV